MGDRSNALVPVGQRQPDLYERRYMREGALVLARAKQVAPRWMLSLMGLGLLAATTGAVAALGPAGLLALPMGGALTMLATVLRVSVTSRAVHVQWGAFGPTIPIESIVQAEACDYDWVHFGGWGIRYGLGKGWMYNMPGDDGRALRIVWRDGRGREKCTWVGTRDADDLALAISEARRTRAIAEASVER